MVKWCDLMKLHRGIWSLVDKTWGIKKNFNKGLLLVHCLFGKGLSSAPQSSLKRRWNCFWHVSRRRWWRHKVILCSLIYHFFIKFLDNEALLLASICCYEVQNLRQREWMKSYGRGCSDPNRISFEETCKTSQKLMEILQPLTVQCLSQFGPREQEMKKIK